MSDAAAAAGVTTLLLGNTALQILLDAGRSSSTLSHDTDLRSDRSSRKFCAADGDRTSGSALALSLADRRILLCVFTLALAELGDRFSGSLLLARNAAFALMWGVGD